MKKTICLFMLFIVSLVGCSTSKLPNVIQGEGYKLTKNPSSSYHIDDYTSYDYVELPEDKLVNESALIAKVRIKGEPVEYKVDYTTAGYNKEGGDIKQTITHIYEAEVLEIYKTIDLNIEAGESIYISRQDYYINNIDNKKHTTAEYIKTNIGKDYIVFLRNLTDVQKEEDAQCENLNITKSNFYFALSKVAQFILPSEHRAIIVCKENNYYEFDQNFLYLGTFAQETKSSINYSDNIINYYIVDKNFESIIIEWITNIINKAGN